MAAKRSVGLVLLLVGFVAQAVAEDPRIPLESLFQMITPKWSNQDLKSGRALDDYLYLSLNGDENAIAYHLPDQPRHIMKSFHGGPGAYYYGVPIILDIEKDGRRYAQCALIYKPYYLERRDQRLFETIGCDAGAGKAHSVPTAFVRDLQSKSVENCGPGCRFHFVSSHSPDRDELIQQIKALYLDETYNYDMINLPKEAATYRITYSVYGGDAFQSIEFDVVEESVRGVASTYRIYRLQGPWQNHAALRYGADKNLYFQYYDQAPMGVMEALERDGELKRDIQLYVIADDEIIAHQDVSETLRRDQVMDENTRPEYNRKKPGLRYDGLDGRGNVAIGNKDQFHQLLENHDGSVDVVWVEKTGSIRFARAWSFEFPGKTLVPEDREYRLSRRLQIEAGNHMSQDRNSDRYFWTVASAQGDDAIERVEAAAWIPDPVRLEREATAARMQADRDRRDQERADRKAEIAAQNATRDAAHERHLQDVAERERAVEAEVAGAQAAAMAEAEAELARAQQMLDSAQQQPAGQNSGVFGGLRSFVALLTTLGLLLGGVMFSREALARMLPPLKAVLETAYGFVGPMMPVLGIVLAACGLLGFLMNTLSLALFANIIPQATALALGGVIGASKLDAKLGRGLALVDNHKAGVGVAAIGVGLLDLVTGGVLYVI